MNIRIPACVVALATACVVALAGCGGKSPDTAADASAPATQTATTPAQAPTPAPVPAEAPATAPVTAAPGSDKPAAVVADCATVVEGNDAMQYNVGSITVPQSCSEFTITLKHSGQMPVAAMGHNLVIATADDMQAIVTDGMSAGADAGYVKPGDIRVIAHTKVIGGGETTTVSFPASKLQGSGPYAFFCTFPGHSALMKGTIAVG